MEALLLLCRVTWPARDNWDGTSPDDDYWCMVEDCLRIGTFPLSQCLWKEVELMRMEPATAESILGGLCLVYHVLSDAMPAHPARIQPASGTVSPITRFLWCPNDDDNGPEPSHGIKLWVSLGLFLKACVPTADKEEKRAHPCVEAIPVAKSILRLLNDVYVPPPRDTLGTTVPYYHDLECLTQRHGVDGVWLPTSTQ